MLLLFALVAKALFSPFRNCAGFRGLGFMGFAALLSMQTFVIFDDLDIFIDKVSPKTRLSSCFILRTSLFPLSPSFWLRIGVALLDLIVVSLHQSPFQMLPENNGDYDLSEIDLRAANDPWLCGPVCPSAIIISTCIL